MQEYVRYDSYFNEHFAENSYRGTNYDLLSVQKMHFWGFVLFCIVIFLSLQHIFLYTGYWYVGTVRRAKARHVSFWEKRKEMDHEVQLPFFPISLISRLSMISGESEREDLLHPFPALLPRGVQPGGHQGVLRQENSLR